jgi:hypothetical protein
MQTAQFCSQLVVVLIQFDDSRLSQGCPLALTGSWPVEFLAVSAADSSVNSWVTVRKWVASSGKIGTGKSAVERN